jgi:hypothetical protein
MIPPRSCFTSREWRLIQQLRTPRRVQQWLNTLAYNTESSGETLKTFRAVVRARRAHCLEAALFAAVVLEQHGHPPVVMSLESEDWLDHVLFLYRENGRWGTIARSRTPGLHGRKAVFRSPREVALSYVDGYVDHTGRLRGYAVVNLAEALPAAYDWRLSTKNVWKVERLLIDWPHTRIRTSDSKYQRLRTHYTDFLDRYGKQPWRHLRGREKWLPMPREF